MYKSGTLRVSLIMTTIILAGCGGDGGSSGSDNGNEAAVGAHTITGTIVGGDVNLAIEDTLNSLSTHSADGRSFEIGKYADGASFSLSVDDPIGKSCDIDTPTGIINDDLDVAVICNTDNYTPLSLTVTSSFDRDGVAYIQVEPASTISAQSQLTIYNVMGRQRHTDDDFQILGSGTLNSSNQLVISGLPSNSDYEIFVVEDGVDEPNPELSSLVTNTPTEFYPGITPSYMSDFQDLFFIESYYDEKNTLKVKFTPRNLSSMPNDWHESLESELLGTYLHGNVDNAIAEVFQLTATTTAAQSQRLGQAQFVGSIKEMVFEAIEHTFVEIRELADLDFSFRLKSSDVGKAASISPFKGGLNCEFTPADNPYQKLPQFKPPAVPLVPQIDPLYDIYVEGKLKIRDGEYLPNDMYLHMEGYLATQVTYGIKAAGLYDGYPVAAGCFPVVFRKAIPMPYFPAAKVGNFYVQSGAELVFGKVEFRGEYSITREFRYPFKTTIGVKDGDPTLSGRLGSFKNEIIGSQAQLDGKAEIESGIVTNVGLELSPGLIVSAGKGAEVTLITTGLKFGGKIAGSFESKLHVLVNDQPLYSMEKIEIGSGPVAEIEAKYPPFPTIKPHKKDWAEPYFKPWVDWSLPSFSPETNQADLGAIQVGDNIDISLLLGSSGSDPSKVDYENIQWRAIPEGTIEFSEFGANRLMARAIPIEDEAVLRQIVVTMSHIDGYEHLDKSIVMNLSVTSKACPSEEQFLAEIGRTKTENNRVHIRPADASDPTQIGECTVKLYESNSQGEWLETEASYEEGLLVNRHSQYQSGIASQSDTFEIIQLSSGSKSAYPTKTLKQSEDKQTLEVSNFRNAINSESTKVFNLQEGIQILLRDGVYNESNLGNFRTPDSDGYQQVRVGTQKQISDMGTEHEYRSIHEFGLNGLVCDDGSTVEKLDSHTITNGAATTTMLYKQYNCPNAEYKHIVNYLSEQRQHLYFRDNESNEKTTKYLPVFETLSSLENIHFLGTSSYVSEELSTYFVGTAVSKHNYERHQLLKIPAGSEYESRPFYGFKHIIEKGEDLFLTYPEVSKYSLHDDAGNIEIIQEEWFEVKEHEGKHVIVKSHDIRENNSPESNFLIPFGKYQREVTEYSGNVDMDDRGTYHYIDGLQRKQYVGLEHEFEFDKAILDGATWSFYSILFDKDASFNYVGHGPYGAYSTLGSQDLCQSGTYENGLREGAYFQKPGCFANVTNDGDATVQSNFKNDKLHGDYYRRDGDNSVKGSYNEGQRHGWWRYYYKGNLTSKTLFDNGRDIDFCNVGSESKPC